MYLCQSNATHCDISVVAVIDNVRPDFVDQTVDGFVMETMSEKMIQMLLIAY